MPEPRTRLVWIAALLAALTAASPPARAQEDDDEADAGKVSVAVFLLPDAPLPRATQTIITRRIELELKKNPRLLVKDKDRLLAEFAGEVPTEAVSEARALARAGTELLEQERLGDAIKRLSAAETALEGVLAFVKKNELADVQFRLGVAQLAEGRKKEAAATMLRLRVWRPSYVVDVEKYSAALPLWTETGNRLEKLPRGSLEVLSEPEGALAFVDGKFIGVTPTSVEALPVGDHYVTLKLEGFQRRVVKAHADPQYQELVTESLPPSEKYLLVEQSLARVRPQLGKEQADVGMVDLRTFLFIDQAVFARVSPAGKGQVKLDAFLYDLRSKRRLSQVTGATVATGEQIRARSTLKELTAALYADVRYDGKTADDDKLVHEARFRGRPAATTPFYRRWWFWTAVGVGAAAIATPFVWDAANDGPTGPSCPDGFTCGEVLLRY